MSTPIHTAAQGYGNIYTPHAGSMIIQVQREMGLANRTIVLSPRKVRLLRFFNSRNGIVLGVVLAASWLVLAVQAARIPLLTARLQHLEHTAQRLDSLETTLADMQQRYTQVQRLLGTPTVAAAAGASAPSGASAPAAAPAPSAVTNSTAAPVAAAGAAPTSRATQAPARPVTSTTSQASDSTTPSTPQK